MNANLHAGRTVPGHVISIKISQPVIAGQASSQTATIVASFGKVRHLLSNKPLRHPNRSRPLA